VDSFHSEWLISTQSGRSNQQESTEDIPRFLDITIVVCPLLFLGAAHQTDYEGQWTDDYKVIIRANSKGKVWEVSDYGRVAPVEVWALETLLHTFKEQNEWAPASGPDKGTEVVNFE